MNAAVSALRFFCGVTLGRGDAQIGMTTVREPSRLSVILSPEEAALRNLKARVLPCSQWPQSGRTFKVEKTSPTCHRTKPLLR